MHHPRNPRGQLKSIVDELFLVDDKVYFSSKSLADLDLDNTFIEQYEELRDKCEHILAKIKNRKLKQKTA